MKNNLQAIKRQIQRWGDSSKVDYILKKDAIEIIESAEKELQDWLAGLDSPRNLDTALVLKEILGE